ncbi:hypothetical protein GX48_07608 [Paracoccidioides brasiliensis]|nr:hypothetical protein GX48_07608 [Paracoccidioides brasiliensis]
MSDKRFKSHNTLHGKYILGSLEDKPSGENTSQPSRSRKPSVDLETKRRLRSRQVLERNGAYLSQYEPRLAQVVVVVVGDSTVTAGDEVSIPIRIYDGNQSANRPVVIFYRGGGLTGWDLDTEDFDPLAHPLWGGLTSLPQTFIQICGIDILRDDAVCYATGLVDAGVDVQSKMYEERIQASSYILSCTGT